MDTWKIAIGVALGITIAGVLAFAVRMYMAQQALNQINQAALEMNAQIQKTIQESQRHQFERAQRELELANQRRIDLANAQRLAAHQRKLELDQVAHKEKAWAQFYKKPAGCDTAEGDAFMACANGHIRAKRKFEDLYATGKL